MPDHPIKVPRKVYAARQPSQDVACLTCQKIFRVSASDLRAGRGRFCSKACFTKAKFNGKYKACPQCGAYFYVVPGRAADNRGHFCSKTCANEGRVIINDFSTYYYEHVIMTDDCWGWSGKIDEYGYGVMTSRGKLVLAHRLSWELHEAPIPDGLCVLHHCDNPPCSRPEHLFLGTRRDNNDDKLVKERQARGEKSGRAKLTDALAIELRAQFTAGLIGGRGKGKRTIGIVATELGIDRTTLYNAINGTNWRHIT